MRAVRFTVRETSYLMAVLENSPDNVDPLVRGILGKLQAAALPPQEPGADMRAVETALVTAAPSRVVRWTAPGYMWSRASREAATLGVTPEKASLVGSWMARQGWMTGTFTVREVLRKWADWYSKANAEARQGATRRPSGLGAEEVQDVGPGAGGQRGSSASGRRPPGLG